MNVDPEDLIPKLPKPKDLQPFPSTQALVRMSCILIGMVTLNINGVSIVFFSLILEIQSTKDCVFSLRGIYI